ncbi:sialate O-acetylesterase [Tamlana sp. 2201CG12-4]|uniref:sialate O-acetylesterase n=1 Tax=Tamlana sp. 2201CG12-4 TaxID=3112582 RepID=UPI002DB7D027|nr:sialate O-acetylesterase [Tamlana sp. 2201CG12-4]MEC3907226.1 sialate O-acetylesterase [Tamlana sp. 2201CG12-4]
MKKVLLVILCSIGFVVQAEVKLPSIFSSNMVLQRNTKINIWGWATPGEKLIVSASWLEKSKQIKVSENGKWILQLKTTNTKEPQRIEITGDNSEINLNNIFFGEVWLCSGQSNMAWRIVQPLKKRSVKIKDADALIESSGLCKIRVFRIPGTARLTPQDTIEGAWQEASSLTTPNFSAVAYSFAEMLEQTLDVPVGIIVSAVGGSKVEAWMNVESIQKFPELILPTKIEGKTNKQPNLLYNAMIHPLIGYTIKGVIWYQGEANRDNPMLYSHLFPELIRQWRREWKQRDLPFYYAQIAPFSYSDGLSTHIREVHLNTLQKLRNTGMAVTMDVGEQRGIHPLKKRIVGHRLALWALAKNYGKKNMVYSGPQYKSHKIKGSRMLVEFDYTFGGLQLQASNSVNFEVAGSDKMFHPAKVLIHSDNTLEVWSEKVSKPVALRYAFSDWAVGTLFNKDGLPASSFRTDNW